MISPEILRRYPFFAGLTHDQLVTLADLAEEKTVGADYFFFHEGEELQQFFVVVQGRVAIGMELPDATAVQTVSGQLTGELKTKLAVVSTIGPGEVFGWSGLVPPHGSTAGAVAHTPCRVLVFDAVALRKRFEEDCDFGYRMMQKAAQVIRTRLRDLRVESLSHLTS